MAIKSGQTSDVLIYGLIDPVSGQVRYVGKTKHLNRRVSLHLADVERETTHKANWLRRLKRQGVRPEVVILEFTDEGSWQAVERKWIAHFKPGGLLTNHTDGGEGTDGWVVSESTRQNMSRAARLRALCPKERERLRSISTGTPPVRLGEANHKARLSEGDVREIRTMACAGVRGVDIARHYGVTPANISLILNRRIWRHVS